MKTTDSVKTTKDWCRPLACSLVLAGFTALAQTPQDVAVELTATVAKTKPVITLQWPAIEYPSDSVVITRTEITATGRGASSAFVLANTATNYADNTALLGKRYEYAFSHRYTPPSGTAVRRLVNITAGSELTITENRGRVLLVVDSTMAESLSEELTQFADDLTLDGWVVVRRDVGRMATSPADNSPEGNTARIAELAATRLQVVNFYNADKPNSKSVVLIGHVPVPYSGNVMPDGHPDHQGAWPADMYYSDPNGSWTDAYVNQPVGGSLNNVPGDGKFDQSQAPSVVELEVGRIDFADLPSQGKTETELLRQYFVRNHAYRHQLPPYDHIRREVVVDDNFGYFGGEAFAAVGWNIGNTVLGHQNARAGKWFTDCTEGDPSLFAYGCGGGNYWSAAGVGSSTDFATTPSRAIFNGLFGSYFGDWNISDGFLRSSLAGPEESTGLASFWVNRPNWDFSSTALGASIGSTLRNAFDKSVHRAVLGDPTLRVQQRPSVPNLHITPVSNGLMVQWDALGAGEIGYHVYRTDLAAGTTVRVTGGTVSTNSPSGAPSTNTFFLNTGFTAGKEFAFTVKPVFRETTPSGVYYDLGVGAFVNGTQPGPALAVQSAVSRRDCLDGTTDTPLVANRSEYRAADGKLKLVIQFNQTITSADVGITGSATVVSQTISGNELTVLLANVANRQNLTLALSNVLAPNAPAAGSFSFPVRVLLCDFDNSGVVDERDILGVNAVMRLCGLNSRATGPARLIDFNNDGVVNNADLVVINRYRGQRIN